MQKIWKNSKFPKLLIGGNKNLKIVKKFHKIAKNRFFIFQKNQFFANFISFYFDIEILASVNRKEIKF